VNAEITGASQLGTPTSEIILKIDCISNIRTNEYVENTRKPCCRRKTARSPRCRCKFRSIRSMQALFCFVWYF